MFLYLLRKNERDLKTAEFDGILGQIREVFSAFPGVLKQPTAHLSTLVPWGARKTQIWAGVAQLVVSFLYLYVEYSIWKSFSIVEVTEVTGVPEFGELPAVPPPSRRWQPVSYPPPTTGREAGLPLFRLCHLAYTRGFITSDVGPHWTQPELEPRERRVNGLVRLC